MESQKSTVQKRLLLLTNFTSNGLPNMVMSIKKVLSVGLKDNFEKVRCDHKGSEVGKAKGKRLLTNYKTASASNFSLRNQYIVKNASNEKESVGRQKEK